VLNVQGDEPLVDGRVLRAALSALEGNHLGTVAAPAAAPGDLERPDVVRVRTDASGRAVDFCRGRPDAALEDPAELVHLGVYSFQPGALRHFARLPQSRQERARGLEQLRALEAGMRIGVARVEGPAASVNRPEDVPVVEALLRRQQRPDAGGRG
jgi:3-deoxy-manno-octulosonate cytidylyltransferase (CMP-KDO synthetase)